MYIACLCPNLVSVHFYAISILHFKFPKFFIYLYNYIICMNKQPADRREHTISTACSRQITICCALAQTSKGDDGYSGTAKCVRLSPGPDEDHFLYFCNFSDCTL